MYSTEGKFLKQTTNDAKQRVTFVARANKVKICATSQLYILGAETGHF